MFYRKGAIGVYNTTFTMLRSKISNAYCKLVLLQYLNKFLVTNIGLTDT